MIKSGAAIYFDGLTSRRHKVTIYLDAGALRIMGDTTQVFTRWPYDQLLHLDAPSGVLRLGRAGTPRLERLEIRDGDLAIAIDALSTPVSLAPKGHRRTVRIVGLSVAAVVAMVGAAIWGVPVLADRIVPLVPELSERWFGNAVDAQVRAMLGGDTTAGFVCGEAESQKAGQAAFAKLVGKLEGAAQLRAPLRVTPVKRSEANAITLPGGHVYVYQGLIAQAQNAEELAAVIGHEIGHAAHRDGLRSVLQTAGVSFLFGVMLGDFVGGGAVVIAAKTLLSSSYSRDVERAADAFGVALMARLNADGRALGTLLQRIDGSSHAGVKILLDHPDTRERIATINALPVPQAPVRLLDESEWTALKRVCEP